MFFWYLIYYTYAIYIYITFILWKKYQILKYVSWILFSVIIKERIKYFVIYLFVNVYFIIVYLYCYNREIKLQKFDFIDWFESEFWKRQMVTSTDDIDNTSLIKVASSSQLIDYLKRADESVNIKKKIFYVTARF